MKPVRAISTETHTRIVETIHGFCGLARDCLQMLVDEFNDINEDTLYGILALEYQQLMRKFHKKTPGRISEYARLFEDCIEKDIPNAIVHIASEFSVCPSLVAKLLVRNYIVQQRELKEKKALLRAQKKSKKKELNISLHGKPARIKAKKSVKIQKTVNKYMKNPRLIKDIHLSYEIKLASLYDNQYGPFADSVKDIMGERHEVMLNLELERMGIRYMNEGILRTLGYCKTPDVMLEEPLTLKGVVINWIESKALFATKAVHLRYKQAQYSSYWNRYGTGLVIYWHGFTTDVLEVEEDRFIVYDRWPDDAITRLGNMSTTMTALNTSTILTWKRVEGAIRRFIFKYQFVLEIRKFLTGARAIGSVVSKC